ncbi:AraC family transcriptional regulator [Methylobacterium sp. Leaf104]|uniref:helix-turn-helix domain-containing protein n=1 Tax=Methylobacterium TaxID=407 RepID=UPI0006F5B539|nr:MULTISPECIES: helix-turn-helix domain-containing protein [Methylobacterium]KQP42757.1 AraC family transcriptional regulator [Methylobacterium sp. Leaf104]MCI9878669.1 helix-turn-helix domain-containing protein [Methylobacterium goesingense]
MYERAAPADASSAPIWHVAGGHTLFAGPLAYNASHQHGAPVYLAGLYGAFRIRFAGGDWITCRNAFIPAGVLHELDCGGDPLGVLYREPEAGPRALTGLMGPADPVGGALVGRSGEVEALRALFERPDACDWAGAAVVDLTAFAARRSDRPIDARIARILVDLRACQEARMSAGRLAAAAGLSSSRMQHLFSAAVGVPFRRYRGWLRMRRAIAAVVEGATFTGAAHAAAFADQAHFANAFRRTFGAPASRSLQDIRRPTPRASGRGAHARQHEHPQGG